MDELYTSTISTYEILPILLESGKLEEFKKKTTDLIKNNTMNVWYLNDDKKKLEIDFDNGQIIYIEK